MLKPIKESNILKRYSQPQGDPPDKQIGGAISIFPNAPFELPSETFANSLNRRDENRGMLLKWIRDNFKEGIHFGRIHLDEQCRFARAGTLLKPYIPPSNQIELFHLMFATFTA